MALSYRSIVALAFPLILSGCRLHDHTLKYLYADPAAYHDPTDRKVTLKRNRQLAEQAWARNQAQYCQGEPSVDFERGFIEGFSDYMTLGGSGEPPIVPPPDYWAARYRTVEGRQLVEEYFSGFRAGAAVAMSCGRECTLVHTTPFAKGILEDFCSFAAPCSSQVVPTPELEPVVEPQPIELPAAQGESLGSDGQGESLGTEWISAEPVAHFEVERIGDQRATALSAGRWTDTITPLPAIETSNVDFREPEQVP